MEDQLIADSSPRSFGAQRRDQEAFLRAGFGLIGDRGFEGLTVAALCNRVGATKGSFYHHFEDLSHFVEVLSQRWQGRIVEMFHAVDAVSDVRRRIELCGDASFSIMKPGSVGMRAWASTNPAVAAAMAAPHQAAFTLSSRAVADVAEERDTGEIVATMMLAMSIGVQHSPRPIGRERWLRLVGRGYDRVGVENELVLRAGRPYLAVPRLSRLPSATTAPGTFAELRLIHAPVETAAVAVGSVREQYFAGAWNLLAEQGPDAMTSRALAQHVGLTKGSFNHHFGSVLQFQRALADHWEQTRAEWIARCTSDRDPLGRLELLLADLLVEPEPAESVWRAWGHGNPIVRDAIRRVDCATERAIAEALSELTDDPDAGAIAQVTLGFTLGLHRWYPPFQPGLIARVAIEWIRRVLRVDAELDVTSGQARFALGRL